jgi:hypothetical protein
MRYLTIVFCSLVIFSAPQVLAQTLQLSPDSIPFAPAVNYGAGDYPVSVFCGDLDGDGDLDLAVANCGYYGQNVSILKNNGDGTFQTAVNYAVECCPTSCCPTSVFCTDLDEDGDLDLAVANYCGYYGYAQNFSILKNNGDGTFESAVSYGAGDSPHSVFCADLDGDGDLDLAVANAGSDNVSILKNNGDGTFQTAVNYGAGNNPRSVFCADLDGDDDLDLAVANIDGWNVSILKNNGDGTFQIAVNNGTGNCPNSVFCADLDGDSDLDLAVANDGTNNVSILKNNGDGTFQSAVNYGAGNGSRSVFCGDMDGDGDLDLAVANFYSDNVSILKNNGNGVFQTAVHYGVGDGPYSVFCADLDGDGDLDLAVANAESDNVSILINLTHLRSYSLLFPQNNDSVKTPVTFNWQPSIDLDPNDTVHYDLYLSRNDAFNPYTVYANLLDTFLIDSLDIKLWYWKVKAYDKWGAVRWSNQIWNFYVYLCGDVNGDGQINVSDVVYLINYLFISEPPSIPMAAGDVNRDTVVNVSDVVYLINYVFVGGPPPCEP